ncbi:MAG: hypothetical protein AVDCRST_MAG19-3664, partial [uncultured Thermomicrobiales bacterium]
AGRDARLARRLPRRHGWSVGDARPRQPGPCSGARRGRRRARAGAAGPAGPDRPGGAGGPAAAARLRRPLQAVRPALPRRAPACLGRPEGKTHPAGLGARDGDVRRRAAEPGPDGRPRPGRGIRGGPPRRRHRGRALRHPGRRRDRRQGGRHVRLRRPRRPLGRRHRPRRCRPDHGDDDGRALRRLRPGRRPGRGRQRSPGRTGGERWRRRAGGGGRGQEGRGRWGV